MKKIILLSFAVMLCGYLFIQAKITVKNESVIRTKVDTTVVSYSGDVKTIIDNKCYGCHNPESKSEKAKNKLNWTTLPALTKIDQISKLDKIDEVMKKGDMPPKKYLERKPEAKLTAEETKTMEDWAVKTSDLLLK